MRGTSHIAIGEVAGMRGEIMVRNVVFWELRLGGTPRPTFYLCPVYGWYVLVLRCRRDITARNNSTRYPTTSSPHRNITARIDSIRSTYVSYHGHMNSPLVSRQDGGKLPSFAERFKYLQHMLHIHVKALSDAVYLDI